MSDTGAERAAGGAHRVDMNPLVIAGGFGEQVDALLADGQPFGVAQVQALGRKQRLGAVEYVTHVPILTLVVN
ncbi:hypothetical protein D3C72_2432730 [compost metagenome]